MTKESFIALANHIIETGHNDIRLGELYELSQQSLLNNIAETFKINFDKIPNIFKPAYKALIEDLPNFPIL